MYTKTLIRLFLIFAVLLSGCSSLQASAVGVPEPDYWPTDGWRASTPEAQGMDAMLLAEMIEELNAANPGIHSVLIIRNGYMLTEAYFHPYTRETKTHIQSVTKSVIGMLVGKAIADGAIRSENEKLVDFYPYRKTANPSDEKNSIRIKHLLSMSSGLDCADFSPTGPVMERSRDWLQFMLDLPVISTPGTTFGYCNGNAHLLSAILSKSTGMSAREYANRELLLPLGIPQVEKSDWGSDPNNITLAGYGLYLRPVDLARLAFLFLHNGTWDGEQVLPARWVADSTREHVQKEDGSGYGYLWTVYPDSNHYAALGLGGQQVHVSPRHNLIVIVTAALEAYAEAPEIEKMLAEYILPAVKSDDQLVENPEATSRLQAAIETAAHPIRPVAALPQTALDISGRAFRFGENPLGWESLHFAFERGSPAAELYIQDLSVIEIGLDNIYRLSQGEPFGEMYTRGRWTDEHTFTVDYPYPMGGGRLGQLGETRFYFRFSGESIDVSVQEVIFSGEPIVFKGSFR